MPAAWAGKLGQLKSLCAGGQLESVLASGFGRAYGLTAEEKEAMNKSNVFDIVLPSRPTFTASQSESRSWPISIPVLTNSLSQKRFDNLYAAIEMYGGSYSDWTFHPDVVLIGGNQQVKRICVIELKQWSSFTNRPDISKVYVPGLGIRRHPCRQVLYQVGSLRRLHNQSKDCSFSCCVFLHNMSTAQVAMALKGTEDLALEAPVFSGEDGAKLAEFVASRLLPTTITLSDCLRFIDPQ